MRQTFFISTVALLSLFAFACNDDEGTEADKLGVGWECTVDTDCLAVELGDGGSQQLECLTDFTGGYCGLSPCASSAECPAGSVCVRHTDSQTYCFRGCLDKAECNLHRSVDSESNCSANFDWELASDATTIGGKACIPPSSGI